MFQEILKKIRKKHDFQNHQGKAGPDTQIL